MATLERAIAIAAQAHGGQLDKAGQPYILHPLRVMLRVHTPEQRIAAVLHDVVEDSDVTLADLAGEGFPPGVLAAVDALTKRPGETRLQAAHRAAADPIARVVKLADNAENMDLSRIPHSTAKDLARMEEYRQVREVLLAAAHVGGEGPGGLAAPLRFALTRDDFKRFQKLIGQRVDRQMNRHFGLVFAQAASWFFLVLAFMSFFHLMDRHPQAAWPLRLLVLFAGLAWTLQWAKPLLRQNVLFKRMPDPGGGFLAEKALHWSDSGLTVENAHGQHRFPWSGFAAVEQDAHNHYLFLDGLQAVIVPKAALTGATQAAWEERLHALRARQSSGATAAPSSRPA